MTDTIVIVTLRPAGTARDRRAFRELFRQCDGWQLTLPGDPLHRPLHFQAEIA